MHHLLNLPLEILREIATYMPAHDLANLLRTNSYVSSCILDIFHKTGLQETLTHFAAHNTILKKEHKGDFLFARGCYQQGALGGLFGFALFQKNRQLLHHVSTLMPHESWLSLLHSRDLQRAFTAFCTPSLVLHGPGLREFVGAGFLLVSLRFRCADWLGGWTSYETFIVPMKDEEWVMQVLRVVKKAKVVVCVREDPVWTEKKDDAHTLEVVCRGGLEGQELLDELNRPLMVSFRPRVFERAVVTGYWVEEMDEGEGLVRITGLGTTVVWRE